MYALGTLLALFHSHHRQRNAPIIHLAKKNPPIQTKMIARDHIYGNNRLTLILPHQHPKRIHVYIPIPTVPLLCATPRGFVSVTAR